MSRLSRFKKGAVIKLPPMNVKKSVKSNSDSDDDFQVKIPSLPRPKQAVAITGVSVQKPSTSTKGGCGASNTNTVESIYFNTDGNVAISKSSVSSESQDEEKRPSKKNRPYKKNVESAVDNEDDVPDGNKVVCPFCWKKLSDKLSGTTHVKSCGKNLPIERIFEALQLHEKQVKEWEGLGIAYPGFATTSNKTTKPKSVKPRSRTKKNKDPELELAMALSVSLHEEIESRKLKEREFLVENGLEKELERLEPNDKSKKVIDIVAPAPPVSYRQKPEKKAKLMLPKMLLGQDNGIGKRRGKKDANLTDTKLYTTTETERQNIINDRVGLILEESSNIKHEEFYVRDKAHLPVDIPKRLKTFHKENSPLWKLAELDCESNTADIFIIQDVAESKMRNDNELVQAVFTDAAVAACKTDLIFENQVEDAEKPFLIPEDFQSPKPVSSGMTSSMTKIGKENMIEVPKVPMSPLSHASELLSLQNCSSSDLPSLQHDHSGVYLPQVVTDLMKMLSKRSFTDIILFGREEKPIKCHKLILRARCPKILKDAVEARSSSTGKVRELISLIEYSHVVVKAFVTFIYSGIIRRSLTSEELAALNALANKYDVELVPDEPPRKRIKTMDSEIQTETLVTTTSFTQTEDLKLEDVNRKEDVNDSSEDIFDISDAIGLDNSKSSIVDRKLSPNNNNRNSNNNPVFDDSGDELFQNMPVVNPSDAEIPNEIIEDVDVFNDGNVSEDMFADFEDEDEDAVFNEIDENVLDGQIPSTSTWETINAKKRTRNISQLSNSSVTSLSATQAALYWRKQLNKKKSMETLHSEDNEKSDSHSNEITSPVPDEKYSKKSKLDTNAIEIENKNESVLNKKIDDNEVIVIDDSDNETVYEAHDSPKENLPSATKDCISVNNSINLDMSLSWEDTYANVAADSNIDNFCGDASAGESPPQKNPADYETPKSSFSSRICTENTFTRLSVENMRNHSLGLNSPSYSPLKSANHSKISPNPFGDHDDSVFARIPEEILNNPIDDQCDLISERESSPSNSNVSDKSNRKGRSKSKAKGGNKKPAAVTKVKFPKQFKRDKNGHRAHSYSQEPQSNCKTPPTCSMNTAAGSDWTPMLNYSTIDTPILKNELKRFGLKPLPRTKAKVLLRHIYKETHK